MLLTWIESVQDISPNHLVLSINKIQSGQDISPTEIKHVSALWSV